MVTPMDIAGRWSSTSLEPIHNADGSVMYGKREFMLGDRTWTLRFTAFGDAGAAIQLFTLRAEGTYDVGDASQAVQGAYEVDFHFAKRYLTAHAPMFVDLFNDAACSPAQWQLDVEQDVSEQGCLFIPSVMTSPTEYDLVKLERECLLFGDRSQDLTDPANRPQQLTQYPLTKH